MSEAKLVTLSSQELHQLATAKLHAAGLPEQQAIEAANHLLYADESGIHSHGVMRVEYYAERLSKGGVTVHPNITYTKTGSSTGVVDGDNGFGHYVVNEALPFAIDMAKESGVAVVGIARTSHIGTLGYFLEKIAAAQLVGMMVCQSDPMVIPYGGSENYYGTNPIGFAAPTATGSVVFDMATTVQAWGKILDARSKNREIPDTWAVDASGNPTTDAHAVRGLIPIAGPKGYGLMMMVDVLSGVLLHLPFGKHVSSMYEKMNEGRDLGTLLIVIDPQRFGQLSDFVRNMSQMVDELHQIKPNQQTEQVLYPGELAVLTRQKAQREGVAIPEDIIAYLRSEVIHHNRYDAKNAFAD